MLAVSVFKKTQTNTTPPKISVQLKINQKHFLLDFG